MVINDYIVQGLRNAILGELYETREHSLIRKYGCDVMSQNNWMNKDTEATVMFAVDYLKLSLLSNPNSNPEQLVPSIATIALRMNLSRIASENPQIVALLNPNELQNMQVLINEYNSVINNIQTTAQQQNSGIGGYGGTPVVSTSTAQIGAQVVNRLFSNSNSLKNDSTLPGSANGASKSKYSKIVEMAKKNFEKEPEMDRSKHELPSSTGRTYRHHAADKTTYTPPPQTPIEVDDNSYKESQTFTFPNGVKDLPNKNCISLATAVENARIEYATGEPTDTTFSCNIGSTFITDAEDVKTILTSMDGAPTFSSLMGNICDLDKVVKDDNVVEYLSGTLTSYVNSVVSIELGLDLFINDVRNDWDDLCEAVRATSASLCDFLIAKVVTYCANHSMNAVDISLTDEPDEINEDKPCFYGMEISRKCDLAYIPLSANRLTMEYKNGLEYIKESKAPTLYKFLRTVISRSRDHRTVVFFLDGTVAEIRTSAFPDSIILEKINT